jgi:hypothetical protein
MAIGEERQRSVPQKKGIRISFSGDIRGKRRNIEPWEGAVLDMESMK